MTDAAQPLPQSRSITAPFPGPRSVALQAERVANVTAGFGVTLPIFVERAEGGILQDVDGNRVIDFASGIAVTSVGATNPFVQARVAEQLARFTHTCFMVTEYEGFTEVCRWLNEHTPGTFEKRTGLFSTGAEAVENAVKIARSATGRPNILVFDEAYHGRSLLTMAMTAKVNPYKSGFGPFPGEVFRAPNAAPLRSTAAPGQVAAEALADVEALLLANDPHSFAAMVIEPIQGEGGFIVPAAGFLPGLRALADKYDIVLVLDEIQAGMGRTGTLFASEHEGIEPDLILTAKALAGGMPLSAVTGRATLMNAVHAGGLGGTYAGNPLSCAAALGVFDAFADGSLLERARGIETVIREIIEPLVETVTTVAELRGRGAMMAIEFADSVTLEPRADIAKAVAAQCHREGVLVLLCGTHGNVLRLLPPLVIGDDLLRDGLGVLSTAIVAQAAAVDATVLVA